MKTLSEEHKKKIGEATKRMWQDGVFNSERIKEIWRNTALSGIAKKGKEGPNKRIPSQEMLDDLSKMGDVDFCSKWKISRVVPVKLRKRYGIQSFNKQHGTMEHKFDGDKEYKWCQNGHWEPVENFGKHTSRWDGLRGHCKLHANESRRNSYDRTGGAQKARDWLATEKGKKSRSLTMLRMYRKRKSYYVKFEPDDEEKIYNIFDCSCAYCKTPIELKDIEFDHFIPVKKGGKTEPTNMLPVCKKCNRGKGGKFDKDPHQWLIERFGEYYGEQIYQDCVSVLQSLLGE